ncbi:MAG TPA: hypothetical protein VKB69_01980, partial [Micromonosporaceae bacterium]|nr:hypothetical protein [Micromonosporaceae bacterium]
LIIVGVVCAVRLRSRLRRRITLTVVGAVAALFLVADQVTVRALLQSRLREQLTVSMPAGKNAADYVRDQGGFWFCLLALLVVTLGNGIGWLRLRRVSSSVGSAAGTRPG